MAIESLIIVAQESSTYQNDRIDVLYLTNMQIMTYDVILTSLWRHYDVISGFEIINDVTVTSFFFEKINGDSWDQELFLFYLF